MIDKIDNEKDNLEVIAVLGDIAATAQGLPPVFTAISLVYKNFISLASKRERYWLPKLIEICKELQEKGFWISPDKEEEFISFLIVLNSNVIKTHQEEKIQLFEKLLKGYLIHKEVDFDINIVFLNLTDRLTLKHIEVLKNINNCSEERLIGDLSYNDLYQLLVLENDLFNIELNHFIFIVDELKIMGLIEKSENIRNEIVVSTTSIIALEQQPFKNLPLLKLSSFAHEYIEFLYRKKDY